jgi:prepilin peptidase CpaA
MQGDLVTSMLVLAGIAIVMALVIYAAVSDLARMIIPNWVSIAIAVLFAPCALLAGLPPVAIAVGYAVGAVMLVIGIGLFHARVMGGGDVKLIAALSIWAGSAAPVFLVWTILAGGVLTVVLVGLRRAMRGRTVRAEWAARLLDPANGAPYAVAICAGVIVAAHQSPPLGAWS